MGCGCTERDLRMAKLFGRARFQPDGSLMYPKKGLEPPPDIDGYKRDPQNHWRFLSVWSACAWRVQNQYLKPCGAIGVLSICTNPEGPKENRMEVTHTQCSTCLLAKYK